MVIAEAGHLDHMSGLMIYRGKDLLLKKVMFPTGFLYLAYGLSGMLNFDKIISKPDFVSYKKDV